MFKKIILLLLPFWAFTACNLSDSMLVTPAKQEVPAAGASFTISLVITDNDPAWTAECDSAWVTIKPKSGKGDGKINVTVAKNPRKVSRSAAIAIRSASSSVFTYVLQAANDKDEVAVPEVTVEMAAQAVAAKTAVAEVATKEETKKVAVAAATNTTARILI